jgi:hypothetical protein
VGRHRMGSISMHKFRRSAFAGLALLATASAAMAHHPSGISSSTNSGPVVTIPATTLDQGAISAWLAFEHISFEELTNKVLEAAALNHEHVHSLDSLESPTAGLAYGVTNRLMVSLQLPYVIRTGIREGAHRHGHEGEGAEVVMTEVIDRGTSEGIGDLAILGQYRFLGQNSGPQAAVLFGVKTPTGVTDQRDNEGELFETEFQPGSGSWDPLVGLAFTHGIGRWSLDSNVLYAAATEGAHQTDLGDRVHYNGAISYRLIGAGNAMEAAHERRHGAEHHHHHQHQNHGPQVSGSFALDAALEINGEWQAKQAISRTPTQTLGATSSISLPG